MIPRIFAFLPDILGALSLVLLATGVGVLIHQSIQERRHGP